MKIDPRRWNLTGGIWGIVGVAALAVVLALAIMMIPRAEVAARVNGERITAEDVEEMQARYGISHDQALDHLITKTILLQEATKGGYLPTLEDAEFELHTQLAAVNMTREDLDLQLELYGISYEEYLEGYRTDLAIQNYLEAAVEVPEVTEEEVEALYDYYRQIVPEDQLPPLEEIEEFLIAELEQQKHEEAISALIDELKEKARIKYG